MNKINEKKHGFDLIQKILARLDQSLFAPEACCEIMRNSHREHYGHWNWNTPLIWEKNMSHRQARYLSMSECKVLVVKFTSHSDTHKLKAGSSVKITRCMLYVLHARIAMCMWAKTEIERHCG